MYCDDDDATSLKCPCPVPSEGVLKIKDCCECEMDVCVLLQIRRRAQLNAEFYLDFFPFSMHRFLNRADGPPFLGV